MEKIEFTDTTGRKRKGVKKTCLACKSLFITRKDQPYTCCSASCRHISTRKRKRCSCAWCKKKFDRAISKASRTKSGLLFCSMGCKNAAQKIGGLAAIMPTHYGTGYDGRTYRPLYKRLHKVVSLSCSRCGYSEFECGVDIHHKDRNCKNNSKANLDALCAPCHRALHKGLWSYE